LGLLIVPFDSYGLSDEVVNDLAMKNFPIKLANEYAEKFGEISEPYRGFKTVIDDFNGDGQKEILVAYSNSLSIELAMLDFSGQLITSHKDLPRITGYGIDVGSYDFDGDGVSEIGLEAKGGATMSSPWKGYVFKWSNSAFTLLTPVDSASKTQFFDASFMDIDHDGTFEIVNRDMRLHRLVEGRFRHTADLVYLDYVRSFSNSEKTTNGEFEAKPDREYRINVANVSDKSKVLIDLSIAINGLEIITNGDLESSTGRTNSILRNLEPNNSIQVTIKGEPGMFVKIFIETLKD
jgi:hypothetical protein